MFLSPGRGFLFIHIPKTGGTALTLALEARARSNDIIVGDTPKARRRRFDGVKTAGRLWKHSTLADLTGILPPDEMERLFLLTLVRNPWDRVASLYHWLLAQHFEHPLVTAARGASFAEFLHTPVTIAALGAGGYAGYVRRADGREAPALFARLERIEEDLAPFEAHLGFRLNPLPRANESGRPADWRPFYSDADADLVARLCAADIVRFGYRFDP